MRIRAREGRGVRLVTHDPRNVCLQANSRKKPRALETTLIMREFGNRKAITRLYAREQTSVNPTVSQARGQVTYPHQERYGSN